MCCIVSIDLLLRHVFFLLVVIFVVGYFFACVCNVQCGMQRIRDKEVNKNNSVIEDLRLFVFVKAKHSFIVTSQVYAQIVVWKGPWGKQSRFLYIISCIIRTKWCPNVYSSTLLIYQECKRREMPSVATSHRPCEAICFIQMLEDYPKSDIHRGVQQYTTFQRGTGKLCKCTSQSK